MTVLVGGSWLGRRPLLIIGIVVRGPGQVNYNPVFFQLPGCIFCPFPKRHIFTLQGVGKSNLMSTGKATFILQPFFAGGDRSRQIKVALWW